MVDRGPIAAGMTSRTTAHLAPICDDGLGALINIRGEEMARLFHQSQEAAVARLEEIVGELGIDCNFRRLGIRPKAARDQRQEEFDAARTIGAAAKLVTGVPLKGFEKAPVIRYPNQATFHPLRYLRGLVAAIRERGGLIFANSTVVTLKHRERRIIAASHAVVATNSPINNRFRLHTKTSPYRTYAMAFTLPHGFFQTCSSGTLAIPVRSDRSVDPLASANFG